MSAIEFEIQRTVRAPVDEVFARLVDIEGQNAWMAGSRSMLKHTRLTTPGEPRVGTTYVDETSRGELPGEIVELETPQKVVFHWWQKSRSGKLAFEGWPSYELEPAGDRVTLVHHRGTLQLYGAYRLGRPLFKRFALRERTTTLEALQASFEPS